MKFGLLVSSVILFVSLTACEAKESKLLLAAAEDDNSRQTINIAVSSRFCIELCCCDSYICSAL